jgi:hypothetical protein
MAVRPNIPLRGFPCGEQRWHGRAAEMRGRSGSGPEERCHPREGVSSRKAESAPDSFDCPRRPRGPRPSPTTRATTTRTSTTTSSTPARGRRCRQGGPGSTGIDRYLHHPRPGPRGAKLSHPRPCPRHDRQCPTPSGGFVAGIAYQLNGALPMIKVNGGRRIEDLPPPAEPGEPGEAGAPRTQPRRRAKGGPRRCDHFHPPCTRGTSRCARVLTDPRSPAAWKLDRCYRALRDRRLILLFSRVTGSALSWTTYRMASLSLPGTATFPSCTARLMTSS